MGNWQWVQAVPVASCPSMLPAGVPLASKMRRRPWRWHPGWNAEGLESLVKSAPPPLLERQVQLHLLPRPKAGPAPHHTGNSEGGGAVGGNGAPIARLS